MLFVCAIKSSSIGFNTALERNTHEYKTTLVNFVGLDVL